MQLGNNTFEIRESVKVRQAQEMARISKLYEEKAIDDIDMAVKTICIMLVSINGGEVSEEWIKDNLDPTELGELSNSVMEIVNDFVKKKPELEYEYETYLNKGSGSLSEEWRVTIIIEKMQWTYQEYLEQPQWLIDSLITKNNLEAKFQKK